MRKTAAHTYLHQLMFLRKNFGYQDQDKVYAHVLLIHSFSLLALFPQKRVRAYKLLSEELGKWMVLTPMEKDLFIGAFNSTLAHA